MLILLEMFVHFDTSFYILLLVIMALQYGQNKTLQVICVY